MGSNPAASLVHLTYEVVMSYCQSELIRILSDGIYKFVRMDNGMIGKLIAFHLRFPMLPHIKFRICGTVDGTTIYDFNPSNQIDLRSRYM